MNKGRIVTSHTKDWFSGHFGGTPYCTGTVAEGDVDPNRVSGEFGEVTNTDHILEVYLATKHMVL